MQFLKQRIEKWENITKRKAILPHLHRSKRQLDFIISHRWWFSSAGVVLLVGLSWYFFNASLAVSATKTLTTQTDWEAGEYYPGTVDTKSSAGDMKIQPGYVGAWDAGTPGFLTDTAGYDYWSYDGASYGADLTTDGTYIYLIVGNRRPYLIRYNPETNTWKQLSSAPTAFFYGGSITYDGAGNIFAIDGQEQVVSNTGSSEKHMYKYAIATDTWTRVADAPNTWGLGSSIAADRNGKIYAVRGINTDSLWVYTIATNAWSESLPSMPAPYFVYTTNGQALEFVNESYGDPAKCAQGCLFTLYGNGNRQFFRYDVAEQQWYYNTPTDLTVPAALGGVGYGSSFAYDSTNGNLYLLHGNQQAYFSKYDVSAETWDAAATTTPEAPGPVYYGGALAYLNGYAYALKGYGVPDFWRYDITNSRWDSISTPAATGNAGENGHVTFVPDAACPDAAAGDCLYVLRGANTNTFWRYNLSAKTWTTLTSTNLGNLQVGSSSCWNGADYIYALGGNGGYNFYRYSLSGNSWTAMTTVPTTHTGTGAYPASPTTQVVSYGGAVTCVGANAYVMKGAANANGSNHFYLFDGTNWTQKAVVPQRVYLGGALVNDGTNVYALAGNLRGDFYRYNIGADSWTALTSLPTATYYTASLAYDGSANVYAISGNYDQKFWRYNIAGNSWTRVADLPARVGYNTALAFDSAAGVIYGQGGMATSNIWKFTPSANNYVSSATWISATQDLNYVSAWEQLSATHPTPGTSSISFALRSSTDKVTWSSWETVVNGASGESTSQDLTASTTPARRYVQIKATLTSDGTNTPTLSDVTVTYTKDSTAPTNPTVTGYSDSTQATSITAGNSYYYVNPYFVLSGASDAHSGVAGYYVAFNTTSGFDPSSSEDYYQTATTYEVNTQLTAGSTYYLRVATKDQAGNVSSPATAFTFVYNGIASASTQVWTAQADFEATGTSESNINTTAGSGTALALDGVSPGTWMDLPATFGTAGNQTSYNDSSLAWDGNDAIFVLRSVGTKTFYKYTISTKTWTALTSIGSTANPTQGSAIVFVPNGSQCADALGCVFAIVGTGSVEFQRYNVQANTWTSRANISAAVGYGGSIVWGGGDYLYAERGGGQSNFYRYSISGNAWSDRATPDYAFNYGGGLVYVPNGTYCADASGCIFALRGGGSNHFWRYDISANSWNYRTAPPTASPAKGNYGAALIYNAGSIYYIAGYASTDFVRYDIANDLWSTLADLPATHYYGSPQGLVYDTSTDTIYALRGYNEYSFYSYDAVNNRWRNPTLPHGLSSNGFNYGGLAYDGATALYVARGGYNNDFYKYTVSTQAWERKADIPMRMVSGSDLVYVSGYVYALTGAPPYGEAASRFYRYDPGTDTWIRLNDTPDTVNYGTNLVWDGVNTIYTARGANTTTYYSYSISGGTWSTQASVVPGAVNNGGCAVMADVSGTKYIYQVRSTNTLNVYRCTLDTGAGTCTWTAQGGPGDPTDAPAGAGSINLYYGAACTTDGTNIFVPRGNTNNLDFLVFNISGNSWTTRSLNSFYYDGRMALGPNNILYGFRGYNTSNLERYVQASSTMSFQRIGTWTSQIIDTGTILDFSGLQTTETLAANTALKYETRTCSNAGCAADPNHASWSAWDEVSNSRTIGSAKYLTIDSTPARYVQVRATLTSDRIYTPTLSDLTLGYYTDSGAPNNPSSANGSTQNGGSAITNNTWTNDATPYFSWTASDNTGGIGLQGFYIYFGADISKDPVTNASDPTNLAYKSGTNYYPVSGGTNGSWDASSQSASALASGTYYLRIKTKDNIGNITSTAADAFTFKLDSITPGTPGAPTANPSGYSSNNQYTFSWAAATDSGGSSVSQYCYKTGRNGSTDACIAGTSVTLPTGECTALNFVNDTDCPAYQARGNTFYVRAQDGAGNYSNYLSTTFYYSPDEPTAPQSLVVNPTSSVNNNTFSFSWDLPATCLGQTPCEASDILRYCYTINAVPSASACGTNTGGNSTPNPDGGWTTAAQSSNRLLAGFSAAVQQGANTLYLVATDAIGNVDYANSISVNYAFTSTAPGLPADIQTTDASDRTTSRYSVTITWSQPAQVGAGVDKYKIYRCTANCDNPSTTGDPPANYTKIAETTTLGYLDTGLSNLTTYYYFVRAVGPGNAASGNSTVVSMRPQGKFKNAPLMQGQPTVHPRIRSAVIEWMTLNDTDLNGNSVDHSATSFVLYGPTTAYGSEGGTSDLVNNHTVTITDLQPNTAYHYQLKWVDIDGNIGLSGDYEFTTLGAPSAPQALSVTPESNTVNRFTFAWSAPPDEGITVSGYFYSVNAPPTEDTAQFTALTSLVNYAAATQQGANTFYVVASDDVGNIDYDNFASVDFEAHTAPPGSPQNITITDSSDRDAQRYTITITWDPPEGVTASGYAGPADNADRVNYQILRSTDATSYSEIATTYSTGYLDTGLDSTKEYSYKIVALDSAGATSPSTEPVSEIPEGRYTTPPDITVAPSVAPDSFAATVTWETERPTSSFVQFGSSASDLDEEQGTGDLVSDHSVTVSGLKPLTKYYYRVKVIDIDENVNYSAGADFTSLAAPRVSDVVISDIRLFDALITWKTNKATTTALAYGPTTDYGFTVSDTSGSRTTTHTIKLENLKDGTNYHVQLAGTDSSSNPVASDDYTFTTLTFPKVQSVTTENQAEGETLVRWTTNVATTSEVEYYNPDIPSKTQGNTALVTDHQILLFGLEDATVYQFKVRGRDQFGYEALSSENSFRTLEDTTPPQIFSVKAESNTIGSGDASRVQIIVSYSTDEPTTTQAKYGQGSAGALGKETDENAELVFDHLVVISDLDPARTYLIQAVAVDKAGNRTESDSYTVLTARKRESFLQLVVSNLEETFSWLGNLRIGR